MQFLTLHNHKITMLTNSPTADSQSLLAASNVTIHSYVRPNSDRMFQLINDLSLKTFKKQPHKTFMPMEKEIAVKSCRLFLEQPFLHNAIQTRQKYDVVFVHGLVELCALQVAYLMSDNVIFLQFMNVFPPFTDNFDLSRPYSYVPFTQSLLQSKMSFFERTWNALVSFFYANLFLQDQLYDAVILKYFPQAPSLQQACRQLSLVFLNEDPVLTRSSPTMPHAIPIGGLHCREPKPLPEDLEAIMDESGTDGVIYFSLGTVVKMDQLAEKLPLIFLSVFSRLNQTILWKSPKPIKNAPKNVKFLSWAPQQDILGHPKTRLYICQGGIFSLQEAIYHRVPVLGLPVFGDQFSNIKRIEELGLGSYLDVFELSEEKLYNAMTNILQNRSFADNATKYSEIFKSQTETPLERALYWTEYVIRNKGGKHLQSASRYLNSMTYFSLDILLVVLTFFLIILIQIKIAMIYKKKIFPKKSDKMMK